MPINSEVKPFDVVIIGAGIQGAGVAQACALNGLSVAVLERNAKGGLETSSASSKLVHGGLRYLETLQLHLVYESLRERKTILKNSPELSHLSKFYIPVYDTSSRSPFWVFMGLSLYALLGGLSKPYRFRVVSRKHWPELPISQKGLRAVFQYSDGQTHDAHLTQAVLKHAQSLGTQVYFDTAPVSIEAAPEGFQIATAHARFQARCLVNATGPWVNECAALLKGAPTMPLDWVQGVHIVLPGQIHSGCFYVEAPSDQRPMFILPWEGNTLVGTTERVLDQPGAQPTEEEIQYLLSAFNRYVPDRPAERQDVLEVMAGVRVLPKKPGVGTNQRHREAQLQEWRTDKGLYLGLYGGKLTTYRAVAEKVSVKIARFCKPGGAVINTRETHIP